jgi:hypothetical protein
LDLDSSFKVIFFVLKAISLNLLIAVEEYKKVKMKEHILNTLAHESVHEVMRVHQLLVSGLMACKILKFYHCF